MSAPMPLENRASRIRTKVNVEVELVMADGTQVSGHVFIGLDQRVQDLLNDPAPFFPLRLPQHEIVLINKSMVAICKPLDATR